MKKIIVAIIISVSFISVSAHAQTHKSSTDAKHGAAMKQMLVDSLHLTDVQADSVISIREEFRGKIKNLMSDTTVSADKRKEEMKPLRAEMKVRLKAILTKEQMQKMQEMHKGKMDDNNQ